MKKSISSFSLNIDMLIIIRIRNKKIRNIIFNIKFNNLNLERLMLLIYDLNREGDFISFFVETKYNKK